MLLRVISANSDRSFSERLRVVTGAAEKLSAGTPRALRGTRSQWQRESNPHRVSGRGETMRNDVYLMSGVSHHQRWEERYVTMATAPEKPEFYSFHRLHRMKTVPKLLVLISYHLYM